MSKTTEQRIHRAARTYLSRGWCAIPVPAKSKNPDRKRWQQERYEPADVAKAFAVDGNIGIHCGEPSNGLVDVDLDCPEALVLAPAFLPSTDRIHGRPSNPRSHWWYVCDPIPPKVRRLKDPDQTTILELRSTGGQTIVPPSLHDEEDEEYLWHEAGDPAVVDGRVLVQQVERLAACALLARRWTAGSRHDMALAVAGALLRHGWDEDGAAEFIEAASRAAGDLQQLDEHRRAVEDTVDALRRDDAATGIPTLVDLLGERETARFLEWLGIGAQQSRLRQAEPAPSSGKVASNGHAQAAPEPVLTLPADTEPAPWAMPKDAPAVEIDELPYWLNRIVRHIGPLTPMFPMDWPAMMALPFWSMLWPQCRIQNLNLALWSLGIGRQGGGKNLATDDLHHLIKAVCAGEVTTYTAGSPEGLWEALEGTGKRVLAYHDEYAGLLKLFSRDHMSHAREALCSLYDMRGVGYLRSKGKSVQIDAPFVAVVATTTASALREHGSLADLTNGYLSRFMICAPDRRNVSPDFSIANEIERSQLAREIAMHRSNLRGVVRVEYAETGRPDPPLINAYREHLGMDTGELEVLEDSLDDASIPGGRLLARAKKIAALLALAEASPKTNPGGQTALIEEHHIRQAITITERGYYYAERVLRWIGESHDVQLSSRVLTLLREHPHGLSRRDLCRRLKVRATDVQDALRLLREEGAVILTRPQTGNSGELWSAVRHGA